MLCNNFFSYEVPSIFARLPHKFLPYVQLSRPYHFAGGVVPCLMGFHFASIQYDIWKWYALFIVGAFLILGAGATINDILDHTIDKQYYRSMTRPIPSGRVPLPSAVVYLLLQLCGAFLVWLYIPNMVKIMTFAELIAICIYPLMKRFMYFAQVYLGIIAGAPCVFSYYLFEGHISLAIILLWLALAIHCIIFDTFFEYSEYFHNQNMQAKSIACLIGKYPKKFFYISSILCLICLCLAGYFAHKTFLFYLVSAGTIGFIMYKIKCANFQNQEKCLQNFLAIQMAGIPILLGIIVSSYVTIPFD